LRSKHPSRLFNVISLHAKFLLRTSIPPPHSEARLAKEHSALAICLRILLCGMSNHEKFLPRPFFPTVDHLIRDLPRYWRPFLFPSFRRSRPKNLRLTPSFAATPPPPQTAHRDMSEIVFLLFMMMGRRRQSEFCPLPSLESRRPSGRLLFFFFKLPSDE